jgi:hypothetical protein
MYNEIISLEMLAIGAKTPLVKLVESYVKDVRSLWTTYPNNQPTTLYDDLGKISSKFIKDVKRTVGANITIDMYNIDGPSAGVMSAIWFNGHSGSRYYSDPALKIVSDDSVSLHQVLELDLKNVTVRGTLADALSFKLFFTDYIFFNTKFLTDNEFVATLLHEFGHIFNTFMTLGDYVWLNYYLTDGIEILMGKRPNKLKLEIFNQRWIDENVPEDLREAFTNDRNEDNAKRVIFSALKKAPRHHLTNNPIMAVRREEQLADMFATRLGYGKYMVDANYKYDRQYGDPQLVGRRWYAETAKVLVSLVLLPVAAIGMIMYDPLIHDGLVARYDDPMTRNVRIRRDLVAQLKNPGPLNRDAIVADIDAIDAIIKEYSTNASVIDSFVNFFRPDIRKQRQNTKVEDDLESLMQNDLFLQAHKLSKL